MLTDAFQWSRCPDGYEWIAPGQNEDDLDSTRIDVFDGQPTSEIRAWNLRASSSRNERYLLNDPELFIRVSELAASPTKETIREFASRYGQLIEPIGAMRAVSVRLWLRRIKHFDVVTKHWARRLTLVPHHYEILNHNLKGLTETSSPYHAAVVAQLQAPASRTVLPRITLTPTSLIGAAWAQLAEAIAHAADYRRCDAPGCGHGFVIRPGYERSTRRFCNDTCRKRALRAAARRKRR